MKTKKIYLNVMMKMMMMIVNIHASHVHHVLTHQCPAHLGSSGPLSKLHHGSERHQGQLLKTSQIASEFYNDDDDDGDDDDGNDDDDDDGDDMG